jgi:phosphate transport system permease protein
MNTAQSIGTVSKLKSKRNLVRKMRSWIAYVVTALCALVSLGILLYLLTFLLFKGIGVINWDFLTSEAAAVGEEGGGIAASLYGTLLIVAIATLFGVPVGILLGVYLAEMDAGGKFGTVTRLSVNSFLGIPSIIVGLFVFILIVVPMGHYSAFAGGLALAIIMVPIVARTTEDVLRLVPGSIREAGLALGVPNWRVILGLAVPAARAGVITGTVLAVARVAGETAPLILTALGNEYINWNPTQPTDELTLRILKYARGPYETWHSQAYGAAFLLVAGVAVGALLLRLATRGRGTNLQ